ncbi:MAG: hypothetical protein WCK70_01660 [Chloroflexales bacterium]
MASRRTQIKYTALEQQYEALMERLSFLKTEQVTQSDPSIRFTLHKQIAQLQQECDSLEQQLDVLAQQLPGDGSAAQTLPPVPVDDAEVSHKRTLITQHQKRLNALELQAAKFGIYAPPHVSIEIEDTRRKIAELRHEIGED